MVIILLIIAIVYFMANRKDKNNIASDSLQQEREITILRRRLNSMERRIDMLEQKLGDANVIVEREEESVGVSPEDCMQVVEEKPIVEDIVDESPMVNHESPIVESDPSNIADNPTPVFDEENSIRETPITETQQVETPISESQKSSFSEMNIGKTLMSVLASILIFISFVRFGGIIQQNLTDTAKVCIMYGISLLAAGIGLWKMRDEGKYKILYTALAACGLGSVYITSLVSYFVFNQLSDIGLVSVIGVWIAVLVYLSRKRNLVFTIICNIGILIATCLTVMQWPESLLGFGLFMVSITALYVVSRTKELSYDWWLFVQIPIVCLAMMLESMSTISLICYAISVTIVIVWQLYHYKIDSKNAIAFLVNTIFTYITLGVCTAALCENWADDTLKNYWNYRPEPNYVFALLIIAGCIYYYRRFKETKVYYVFLVPFVISALLLPHLYYGKIYQTSIGYILPAVALLALGAWKKDWLFRGFGYAYLMGYLVGSASSVPLVAKVGVFAVVMVLMVLWTIRHYSEIEKFVLTFMAIAALFVCQQNQLFDTVSAFVMVGFISLFANTRCYHTNLLTKKTEETSTAVGYLINLVVLICGITLLPKGDAANFILMGNEIMYTEYIRLSVLIMMVVALTLINNKKLIEEPQIGESAACIYIGIKICIVVLAVLLKFQALQFVISIVGIAIAIIFIIIGFRFSLKAFRLYGLALTMICVLKLALFDIEYSTSIMKPVGFFVAGALCYSISWLYSRLEKKNM